MKLIIEVNKEDLDFIRKTFAQNSHDYIPTIIRNRFTDAVLSGTPIPDNATNGEIMQMMFPNGVTAKFATFMRFVVGEDEYINCAYDWWNAPYQKGGKE